MLIDVDYFKQVNDLQGHQAGDVLLRELAGALSRQSGDSDALYRIGGDEFAAIVASGDAATAIAVADRLVAVAQGIGAPVSLGWSLIDAAPVQVRSRADSALYAAKHAGRGTYRPASPASQGSHQN
jgi:diguanylate cyclase (GGDEF)-like protein